MRVVIEQSEFQRLSPETQREIIERLAGSSVRVAKHARSSEGLHWRRPVDLTEDMAARLVHGLSDPHRRRLELFARKGGRVRQQELLSVTGDNDVRALSHFQAVLTRRLRRFFDDPDKRIHLIGWDFDDETWDQDHKNLIDGTYYVTNRTARALQAHFGVAG